MKISECLKEMQSEGVKVVYGRWLVDDSPPAILFDLEGSKHRLNEWKSNFWTVAQIPSPSNDKEFHESILFGYLTAWFIGLVKNNLFFSFYCIFLSLCMQYCSKSPTTAVLAHFHEWLASVGLILCNKRNIPVGTIFTTHATLLGRYLCAGNVDFYNSITSIDIDAEAGKRGIYSRYCIERAATHCADVFTTVSHITAYEAEHLLCRKPDGVLPNGLNVIKFSAMHEFQNLHASNKKKINSFIQGHFHGYIQIHLICFHDFY